MTAAPNSPIASLAGRREEIIKDLFLEIRVPRWDNPEVWVRYNPVGDDYLNRFADPERNRKRKTSVLDSNADMLVNAVDAVYAVGSDGNRYSLKPGDPTGPQGTFDTDLRDALGMVAGTARETCKFLFFTPLDLASHVRQLVEWSGATNAETNEELAGE